jgi:hypothetical protein
VLEGVRVRVVADPIAQAQTQGRVSCRVSGAVDLASGVEWFQEPVAQLLELVVEIDQGDLGVGVFGEGGYRTTSACDRIALGLLANGDAGRSTGATVRIRWQCRRNLAPLSDVGERRL